MDAQIVRVEEWLTYEQVRQKYPTEWMTKTMIAGVQTAEFEHETHEGVVAVKFYFVLVRLI